MTGDRPSRVASARNGVSDISARRPAERSRVATIVDARCPRCRDGHIFHGRFAMHQRCPTCALRFEREPGYFTGAMYVSYALAVPLLAVLAGLVHLVAPEVSLAWTCTAATLLFLPFVPVVFRSSRTLWIHLDRSIDPSG